MSDKSYPFVQKISIDDQPLDMANMVSLTYIENHDLSGPSITLKLRDEQSIIRDTMGLKENSMITIEMGDVTGSGEAHFEETFIVSTCPTSNDIITVEGFQIDCDKLKVPASKPRFFTEMSPKDIIAELLPSLRVNCLISGVGTYHLNQGKSPSRLLRNLARDFGAHCFIARGVVNFIPKKVFSTGTPIIKLGLNSPDCDIAIQRYNKLSEKAIYERTAHRSFSAWTTDKGFISSTTHQDKPSVLLAYPTTIAQLTNQSLFVLPIADVVIMGHSTISPCTTIDLEVIKLSQDAEMDESVDRLVGVHTIAHFAKGSIYTNRIVLGIKNE